MCWVLSTILTLLMILGCIFVVYRKKIQGREQRKANAQAKLENDLNAVNCVNKSKMLDDHMIQNDLDYPKHKRINGNPNLADEELFNSKEGASYKSAIGVKQLNTDSSRASLLLDKLESCSSSSGSRGTLNKAALAQLHSETCSSSTTSSTGAPSVCSSR